MKKGLFGIYKLDEHRNIKVEAVNGYILDYGRFRFGIRKIGKEWSITELSTGMLTGLFTARKKDIIQLLDNNTELLNFIQQKIDNPTEFIKRAQEQIRKFYTVQPAE